MRLYWRSTGVCALAGDRESVECIKEDAGTVERDELDDIDPINETIVLEADEYQREAIHSLIRFNADGVVDGPPGTGKSQTIANLIAGLLPPEAACYLLLRSELLLMPFSIDSAQLVLKTLF